MTNEPYDTPHAALLERVHARGDQLRRRRRVAFGASMAAAVLVLAIPVVAVSADDPAIRQSDVAASTSTADPPTTVAAPPTSTSTTDTARCGDDPACPATTTTLADGAPPTTTSLVPRDGVEDDAVTPPVGDDASTTTSLPTPPTTPAPPPNEMWCTHGDPAVADTLLWVSNQSFDDPSQRIVVRIDGAVVVDQVFAVEGQHTFVSWCLTLGPGSHTVTAEVPGSAQMAVVDATAGNGVVVLAWDGGDVRAETSVRWQDVGFA